jgi:hypothetical protein
VRFGGTGEAHPLGGGLAGAMRVQAAVAKRPSAATRPSAGVVS